MKTFKAETSVVVAAVTLLLYASQAWADESNRNEVRANLERDGWRVIWGKNFTEADWVRGTKAIAESVAAENPGPFLAWFEQTLDENFTKIERNLRDVTRRDLERWIIQSLKEEKIITYKGFRIQAGFATYNRWERVVYDEPRTRRVKQNLPLGGWTWSVEAYTERVEKTVPLPNWHQFYVRYQLVREGASNGGTSGSVSSGGASNRSIQVSFRNRTNYRVGFFLNGGRGLSTSLEPRQTMRYTMIVDSGVTPAVRISQLGGGTLSFTLSDGGAYDFGMDGQQIRNFYRR